MNRRTDRACSLVLAFVSADGGQAAAQEPAPSGDYVVGPRDLIEVKVLELPELNVDRRVTDSGTLDFLLLVGSIPVAGMTASDIRARARGARSRPNTSTGPTSRSSSRSSRTSRSPFWARSCTRARWLDLGPLDAHDRDHGGRRTVSEKAGQPHPRAPPGRQRTVRHARDPHRRPLSERDRPSGTSRSSRPTSSTSFRARASPCSVSARSRRRAPSSSTATTG